MSSFTIIVYVRCYVIVHYHYVPEMWGVGFDSFASLIIVITWAALVPTNASLRNESLDKEHKFLAPASHTDHPLASLVANSHLQPLSVGVCQVPWWPACSVMMTAQLLCSDNAWLLHHADSGSAVTALPDSTIAVAAGILTELSRHYISLAKFRLLTWFSPGEFDGCTVVYFSINSVFEFQCMLHLN